MNELKGKCLCGDICFTISSEPHDFRICWCQDCQHISGNGTANLVVNSDHFEILGKPAEFKKLADSGNEVTRKFCSNCGVHIFSQSSGRPGLAIVRAGNIETPLSIRPTSNIWTVSAPDWACLDLALDQVEKQPVPPHVKK